jgi:CHAD domain-containing protein
MRRFALEKIADLLTRLAAEVEHAKTIRDMEAVHDLRVTIRRFGQSLRAFSAFVPHREVKRIGKQLRHIMHLTGEVRNRDITLDLLAKAALAGCDDDLGSGRELAMRILVSELNRWQVEQEAVRWRAALELPSP